MCGNGLPAGLRAPQSALPIVLAFVVVIGLFVSAFLLGKWRADNAPVMASAPHTTPAAAPVRGRPAQPATAVNGEENTTANTPKDRP
jgi:hypothetical protein